MKSPAENQQCNANPARPHSPASDRGALLRAGPRGLIRLQWWRVEANIRPQGQRKAPGRLHSIDDPISNSLQLLLHKSRYRRAVISTDFSHYREHHLQCEGAPRVSSSSIEARYGSTLIRAMKKQSDEKPTTTTSRIFALSSLNNIGSNQTPHKQQDS